ncbi:AEC family transporter [Dactylosporangium aurantiacum]|uniref:AEC family transporter n=1 Tax=Dactylosporangium aurantiacum TaxID=35754 RepID=A0A9Q9IH84_9ACTN|nr:AEC family transporter [Dactylosporangium aurantiacum]MDG6104532.1 AEC family transporter [Dactylosporangium aurantiacum]UWZ56144.1 AEC family transporter [Dactylosporangium aurantiacum]
MLAAFVPIWALTLVGFVAGRTGVLGFGAVDVLGRFVFYVAMPAALLDTLTRQPITGLAGRGVAAFVGGTLAVAAVGFGVARWVTRRALGEQVIAAMAAGYVNAGNLGIPVAVQVLGDASFIAVVLLIQTTVLTPVILGTLDVARDDRTTRRWRRLATVPLRSPVMLACVAGVVLGAAGVELPRLLAGVVALLGDAAVPSALVALGLSLVPAGDADQVPARPAEVALSVLLKSCVQPVVCFLLARFGFGLDGDVVFAAVLCSALPTAQNTFVFARAYGVDGRFPRDAVVASTAVSMVTLTVATALLG